MLYANDKLYTFTTHFEDSLRDRAIDLKWVEAVLENPVRYELSNVSGNHIYEGIVEGHDDLLRVVVNEEQALLVTTFFVTKA